MSLGFQEERMAMVGAFLRDGRVGSCWSRIFSRCWEAEYTHAIIAILVPTMLRGSCCCRRLCFLLFYGRVSRHGFAGEESTIQQLLVRMSRQSQRHRLARVVAKPMCFIRSTCPARCRYPSWRLLSDSRRSRIQSFTRSCDCAMQRLIRRDSFFLANGMPTDSCFRVACWTEALHYWRWPARRRSCRTRGIPGSVCLGNSRVSCGRVKRRQCARCSPRIMGCCAPRRARERPSWVAL